MNDAPCRRTGSASRRARWWPFAAWTTFLVVATSWPNPHPPDVPSGDKVVHVVLYGVLALLAWRAVATPSRRGGELALAALATLAFCVAFGWLDEWHQQYVPGRSRSSDDWAADAVGATLGLAAGAIAAGRRERLS